MEHPFKRLVPAAIILSIVVIVGVLGYITIEGWSVLDAFYMVVITLFTIGFEEVHRLSPAGEIFTMFIIVTGVGTAIYAAGQMVEVMVEGEMLGYRKRRVMKKKIREMKNHYIICGFGRVGHQVAEDFESTGVPYVVIDSNREAIVDLEVKGTPHIMGDATSDDTLEEAGIRTARGLVACSDSDVANVYVTLSSRALNPNLYIVARAGQRETEKKLGMAGANRVISPYFISGKRMAALATQPVISDFLDMIAHGGQLEFRLHELRVSDQSDLIDKTLKQADIRGKSGALVLAVQKADGSFELQPRASSMIRRGDILVVIGTQEQIELLREMADGSLSPRLSSKTQTATEGSTL